MIEELKPCPFCGSRASRSTEKATMLRSPLRVSCSDDGCGAHYGSWHPKEWNTRAAPPATGVIVPKSRFNNYEITLMINDLDHAEYSDITAALREYAELRALLAQSQEVKL